jgi:hypothetical protein
MSDAHAPAFPDLHIEVEDRLVAGDKVVYRNVVTGTHRGVYKGGRVRHFGLAGEIKH